MKRYSLRDIIDGKAGENLDPFAARETAYAWHGGQNSPLYSFASTECTVWSEQHRDDLIADIKSNIEYVRTGKKGDEHSMFDMYESQWLEQEGFSDSESVVDKNVALLENLLGVVEAVEAKHGDEE